MLFICDGGGSLMSQRENIVVFICRIWRYCSYDDGRTGFLYRFRSRWDSVNVDSDSRLGQIIRFCFI